MLANDFDTLINKIGPQGGLRVSEIRFPRRIELCQCCNGRGLFISARGEYRRRF